MGLDSVELIMEVEKYFGISILDREAEVTFTIQDMVNVVARHLDITNENTELREIVFDKVNQALLNLSLINAPIKLTEYISKYLSPDDGEIWDALKNELKLDVPKPDIIGRDSKKFIDKIKFAMNWTPMYDWSSITVEQFIAAISAINCDKLIDKDFIRSTYEIYIAITAITVDKIGVDYYEISPDKSFTQDLGVD